MIRSKYIDFSFFKNMFIDLRKRFQKRQFFKSRDAFIFVLLFAFVACNNTSDIDETAPLVSKPEHSPTSLSATAIPSQHKVASTATPELSPSLLPSPTITNQLNGTIKNRQGKNVNTALLTLEPGPFQTWSYGQGKFVFKNLPKGNYQLSVDKEGYASHNLNIKVDDHKPETLSIELWPALKQIDINPETFKVYLGVPLKIDAIARFTDGSVSRQLRWNIINTSIANVNEQGLIKGLKAGKTTLQVALIDSNVWQKELEFEVVRYIFDLMGPGRMNPKSRVRVFADPPTDPRFAKAEYNWTSSNPEVATIKAHPAQPGIAIVEALQAGEVEIQANISLTDEKLTLHSKKLTISIEDS